MLKVTGFDKIRREMDELGRALKALNGPISKISFDPGDPASVRDAIRKMERAVDGKVARYRSNPLVRDIADAAKSSFKSDILEQARKSKSA